MARILLVEDEMLVRELAFEDLTDEGFDVVPASNGDEALAILREDQSFDLMFTDIRMPGAVDGYGVADEGKRLIDGLKIIYATGLTDDAPLAANERTLSKPYSRETLLALLADLGILA